MFKFNCTEPYTTTHTFEDGDNVKVRVIHCPKDNDTNESLSFIVDLDSKVWEFFGELNEFVHLAVRALSRIDFNSDVTCRREIIEEGHKEITGFSEELRYLDKMFKPSGRDLKKLNLILDLVIRTVYMMHNQFGVFDNCIEHSVWTDSLGNKMEITFYSSKGKLDIIEEVKTYKDDEGFILKIPKVV